MATKANSGAYDCYAKLADDEPYFLLRAKDPVAPFLIELWRLLRAGLSPAFMDDTLRRAYLMLRNSGRPDLLLGSDKSREAARCAEAMTEWYNQAQAKP